MFRLLFLFLLLSGNLFCQADTNRLRVDLVNITGTASFRHFMNPQTLDSVAAYIFNEFTQSADSVYYQDYKVNGVRYRNVVALFSAESEETVVVGAHYDVCGMQQGADDNASGTAGLIELSRLLKGVKSDVRIELVAFTLEEPPYFRTEHMGSFQHARSLSEAGRNVRGMISLEMIGYFDDRKRTQDYPIKLLKLFYGGKGDYISLVNKTGKGSFARRFTRRFKRNAMIEAKSITAPKVIPGIDFSDHLNYWHFGYSALMITDTAFYRNKNYHQQTDTLETLDLGKMAQVVNAVFSALIQ